jgi:hypothetical protein
MKKSFIIISMLLPLGLRAESYGAGSQAAPWLKLPNAARAAAMGEAAVAVPGDVNSLSVNPAGLAEMQGSQASLLHHAYVQDSSMEHLAFGMKAGEQAGAALGVDYLNFGSVERYDLDGSGNLVAKGTFNPSSMALNLGYGRAMGSFAAGLNVKMVSQSLDGSSSSSAFGADLGALWRQGKEGASAGLALQNLGSQLDGASLPLNIKVGAAYALALREAADRMLFAVDANVPTADSGASSFCLGAEYAGASLWALRAGYKVAGNGGAGGLSAGAGLSYSVASLDYAFLSQGALGSSNQLSLTLKF